MALYCCTSGYKNPVGTEKIGIHSRAPMPYRMLSAWYGSKDSFDWNSAERFCEQLVWTRRPKRSISTMTSNGCIQFSPPKRRLRGFMYEEIVSGRWKWITTKFSHRIIKVQFAKQWVWRLAERVLILYDLVVDSQTRDIYLYDLSDNPFLEARLRSWSTAGILVAFLRYAGGKLSIIQQAGLDVTDSHIQSLLKTAFNQDIMEKAIEVELPNVLREFKEREQWTDHRSFRHERKQRRHLASG